MNDFNKAASTTPRIDENIKVADPNIVYAKNDECGYHLYEVEVEFFIGKSPFEFPIVAHEWFSPFHDAKHRLFGPCETWHCQETGALVYEEYREKGQLHRLGGRPAVVYYDRDTGEITKQEFYEEGNKYDPSDYDQPAVNI